MLLKFIKENDSHYALAEYEVYEGQVYEELWYAEIDPDITTGGVVVRWEDSYKEKIPFPKFHDARKYVIDNYKSHKPMLVGKRYTAI